MDLTQTVVIMDVLKAHMSKLCMDMFNQFQVNAVVANLPSTAETQPIEQIFSVIKMRLIDHQYDNEIQIIEAMEHILQNIKNEQVVSAWIWSVKNWKLCINHKKL